MCLAKFIEDDFWQVHGIWHTSLRYNLQLNTFSQILCSWKQVNGPLLFKTHVCISSTDKENVCVWKLIWQLHMFTYYVFKAQVSYDVFVERQFHRELLWRTTYKFGRIEQGHDAELTEALANASTRICFQEQCADISKYPGNKLYLRDQLYAC